MADDHIDPRSHRAAAVAELRKAKINKDQADKALKQAVHKAHAWSATVTEIAHICDVDRSTIYRWIRE